jgi:hypothetical protein
MSIRYALVIGGFIAGIGGLVLPALAQAQDDAATASGQSMSAMADAGRMIPGRRHIAPDCS